MKWTAEMYRALGTGLESGLSASLIAKQMGISRNAVVGKCFRVKVNGQRRKPTVTLGHRPSWVKLNAEILRLVSDYARAEGVKVDTAANELLRGCFLEASR